MAGWKHTRTPIIVGTESKPVIAESGQTVITKKATKKNLSKLVKINNDGLKKAPKEVITNNGTKGGLFKGKAHYDKNGKPLGGIPAIVDGNKKIEVEGDEFLVNEEASKKHWKELSKINQSGGGVPILPPNDLIKNTNEYKNGGNFNNKIKNTNFTLKITSDEIKHIISGEGNISDGSIIQSISNYLRTSKGTSEKIEKSKQYKEQETQHLVKYITDNNLWVSGIKLSNYISEGAEQKVYLLDNENVIKVNDAIFYTSWEDYLNSLLLHNIFFPDTSYQLIGFTNENNSLQAVVKQPFIKETKITDLDFVKKFMAANGFINKKNNDYYNPELGIILEDLHDENVLTKDGILYFIDTVFYISEPKKLTFGGAIGAINKPSKLFKDSVGRNRFEIDDSTAEFDLKLFFELVQASVEKNEPIETPVSNILISWGGYKYYPNVKDLILKFQTNLNPSILFAYSKHTNKILINSNKIDNETIQDVYRRATSRSDESRKNSSRTKTNRGGGKGIYEYFNDAFGESRRARFFHELQHALQQIEGIEISYSNPIFILEELKKKYDKTELNDSEFKEYISKKLGKPYQTIEYNFYKEIPSEKEALLVEKRINLTKEERESSIHQAYKLSQGGLIY